MNTSALNRPFDDQAIERVRLEAEAVSSLVSAIEEGRLELVGSDYLDFEVSQNPDLERARRVGSILRICHDRVRMSAEVAARARDLEQAGLRGLDALHVAAAEAAHADLLVTTDDRMIRRVTRAGSLVALRLVRPQDALALLDEEAT